MIICDIGYSREVQVDVIHAFFSVCFNVLLHVSLLVCDVFFFWDVVIWFVVLIRLLLLFVISMIVLSLYILDICFD